MKVMQVSRGVFGALVAATFLLAPLGCGGSNKQVVEEPKTFAPPPTEIIDLNAPNSENTAAKTATAPP